MLAQLLFAVALLGGTSEPDTSARLPRGGSVEIDVHTRNVSIRTGTSDLVSVRNGTLDVDGKTFSISADDLLRNHGGNIDIVLPIWARVSVSTYTGNIIVDGAPERLEVQTFQGTIRVTGGAGSLDLQSAAGAITVTDFKGNRLSADATGNDITVTNASGRIEAASVSGNVRLRGIRSPHVEATSVSGVVEFEGPFATDGRYAFESHAGGIMLTLPADVDAQLHISTFGGKFLTQIPATRRAGRNDDGDDDFVAVFGKGAAHVTIDSFSGDIRVLKAGGR
ncbi:MAG: DUF4097 family beta strand repeat-containing protein [Gemmatimonadales bacterium]